MRKVKWGIIGTAMICERDTIPGMLKADNVELTAIAGRNPEKVDRFQKQYGFKKTYYSYDALLEDPEIEVVYVALPNTMHYEWTIRALNHKKHVLCEKPLAPSQKEAEEMFAAARENHVFLMEAYAYLHTPYIKALCDEIQNGTIGTVRFMSATFFTSDYDIGNIRMRNETRGGSLYDLGVYTGTLIRKIMGEDPVKCEAVAKFSDHDIDLLTNAILEYKSGATANLICGMTLKTEENRWLADFEIDGSEGTILSDNFVFNGLGDLSYTVVDSKGNRTRKVVPTPHNYMLEVEQMGRCITEGEKPAVSEEFSVACAGTIDMILDEIGYRTDKE